MGNLIGLWGSERVLGPEISGELTVTREGAQWRAQVAKRSVQDDLLHLPTRRGDIAARYDQENDTLSFMPPGYSVTLDFTRRAPDQAAGFYPRTPPVERYVYRPPLAEDDGWATGSL